MAETNTLITEEDIQKQRELVSKLEANMQSLQARLPESSAHMEELQNKIKERKQVSELTQAGSDVLFDEKISLMPQMYEELRKKYQMIENDPQVRVLQNEVHKAELDTVYGPNPVFEAKSKELETLLKSNQETMEALQAQMASYRPIEISQLDRILNRYRDAEFNPEDMYYVDYEKDRDFLEELANRYFPNVNQEQKSNEVVSMEQEQDKLRVQRDILATEVHKAELDTVYGPNPVFETKSKELEEIDNRLKELDDKIKASKLVSPKEDSIERMRKQYHDLRTRVERARDDADDMYLDFEKEQKLLHEIERAAYLHYCHRDAEINLSDVASSPVPENSGDDLEEQLHKVQEEHNKLIGDVNKARADLDVAKDKLEQLVTQKDKQQTPPANPFDNAGTVSVKATRWECKYQGYPKDKLVKIATSTAFGKKIYDGLRAKRAEKYAKKLNRLQEVYDISNANYERINGNYKRFANEIQSMQDLIDQKLVFEKLNMKVNNESKSIQTLIQRREVFYKNVLDSLNVPDDQKLKISEAEVRKMLAQQTDESSKKMLDQLEKYAKIINSGIVAMKKDKEKMIGIRDKYHQALEQHGFDPKEDSKTQEMKITERLDQAKEELHNFDLSQLETLASYRLVAEEKLNRFKDYIQRCGATITPIEVELDADDLSKRNVKSTDKKQNRFTVGFINGLKDKLSHSKDKKAAKAFANAGEFDEDEAELAASAFANAGELGDDEKTESDHKDSSAPSTSDTEADKKDDFSVPIQPSVNPAKATDGLPVDPPTIFTHAPQKPDQIRVVRPPEKTSEGTKTAPDLKTAILGTDASRVKARTERYESKPARTVAPDTAKTTNPMVSAEEAASILAGLGINYNELSPAAQQHAREHYANYENTQDSSKTSESGKHM